MRPPAPRAVTRRPGAGPFFHAGLRFPGRGDRGGGAGGAPGAGPPIVGLCCPPEGRNLFFSSLAESRGRRPRLSRFWAESTKNPSPPRIALRIALRILKRIPEGRRGPRTLLVLDSRTAPPRFGCL